jgi:hypothetical protein
MTLYEILGTAARLLASLAFAAGAGASSADTFPSKPITLVVPFGPGSVADIVGRVYANDLSTVLNTPVVVDNRPGANQTVAGPYVYRAKPDGYTLFMPALPIAVLPSMQGKLPYAGVRSFTPIADMLKLGFVMVAAPSVQAQNLQEFMALVRKDPTKHSFGSAGLSTALHLYGEMFNKELGVKTLHVPYKGGTNEVMVDLIANRITFAFVPSGAMEFVRSGRVKAFGLVADRRDAAYPDLPTMEEAGMLGFKTTTDAPAAHLFIVGPPQMPADIQKKLNEASNMVLSNPAFPGKVRAVGIVGMSPQGNPAQVAAAISTGEARWDALIKGANIPLE